MPVLARFFSTIDARATRVRAKSAKPILVRWRISRSLREGDDGHSRDAVSPEDREAASLGGPF